MQSETKIRQHQWVKMTICPISVLGDEEGNPVVFVDPEKQESAEDGARFGCFACNASLEESFGTECNA